jgi:hypothetical protein
MSKPKSRNVPVYWMLITQANFHGCGPPLKSHTRWLATRRMAAAQAGALAVMGVEAVASRHVRLLGSSSFLSCRGRNGEKVQRLLRVVILLDRRSQLRCTAPRDEDVRAFVHELLCRGQANAAVTTSDECSISFKLTHGFLPFIEANHATMISVI